MLGNRCEFVTGFGDDHDKRMPLAEYVWHAKKNPQLPRVPSIGQHLKPFTGNDVVTMWVRNSRVERKTNKQTYVGPITYLMIAEA